MAIPTSPVSGSAATTDQVVKSSVEGVALVVDAAAADPPTESDDRRVEPAVQAEAHTRPVTNRTVAPETRLTPEGFPTPPSESIRPLVGSTREILFF